MDIVIEELRIFAHILVNLKYGSQQDVDNAIIDLEELVKNSELSKSFEIKKKK